VRQRALLSSDSRLHASAIACATEDGGGDIFGVTVRVPDGDTDGLFLGEGDLRSLVRSGDERGLKVILIFLCVCVCGKAKASLSAEGTYARVENNLYSQPRTTENRNSK
jgi:hypothetical protein